MPTLDQFKKDNPVKMLLIGDSGSGKTGALASLVDAGYKVRVLDLDSGLDALVARVKDQSLLKNVGYMTLIDKRQSKQLNPKEVRLDGPPTAYSDVLKSFAGWKKPDGSELFPPVKKWDTNTVLVLDSLQFFSMALMNYVTASQGRAINKREIQDYNTHNIFMENFLSILYNPIEVPCNVIVTSHVAYRENEGGAITKGFPSVLGNKLPQYIATYFNTTILVRTRGTGAGAKRELVTTSEGVIELKCPSPNVPRTLPLETGLATLFSQLKA